MDQERLYTSLRLAERQVLADVCLVTAQRRELIKLASDGGNPEVAREQLRQVEKRFITHVADVDRIRTELAQSKYRADLNV